MPPKQRENPTTPSNEESLADTLQQEFALFVTANGFTAAEIEAAYYRVLDNSETSEVDPAILQISAKIESLLKNDFPLNRIASTITETANHERALTRLEAQLGALKISDNERRMLLSIVHEGRKGMLSCLVNGSTIAEQQVDTVGADPRSSAETIMKLIANMTEQAGVNYEFTFSEE